MHHTNLLLLALISSLVLALASLSVEQTPDGGDGGGDSEQDRQLLLGALSLKPLLLASFLLAPLLPLMNSPFGRVTRTDPHVESAPALDGGAVGAIGTGLLKLDDAPVQVAAEGQRQAAAEAADNGGVVTCQLITCIATSVILQTATTTTTTPTTSTSISTSTTTLTVTNPHFFNFVFN